MESLFETTWFRVAVQGGVVLLTIASALVLSSAIALNKGAKANVSWGCIAAGLVLFGAAEGNRLLEAFGAPMLSGWDRVMSAAGTLLIVIGALTWRHLLKKTLS